MLNKVLFQHVKQIYVRLQKNSNSKCMILHVSFQPNQSVVLNRCNYNLAGLFFQLKMNRESHIVQKPLRPPPSMLKQKAMAFALQNSQG